METIDLKNTGFDVDNTCWKKKDSRFEDPIRNKREEREGNMENPLLKTGDHNSYKDLQSD